MLARQAITLLLYPGLGSAMLRQHRRCSDYVEINIDIV
uniref:Uncharacterized protein n=1 Tax=Arundo donax TaxID=35708 RepID=A0A0A9G329_ARUDO